MYLTFRRARLSDFEAGYALVRARYGYQPAIKKDMLKLWRVLLENGHDPFIAAEDRDRPSGQRLVSFGVSFFAYDWFMEEARTNLPPFLDRQVFEKWRSGKRPFLLKDEIVDFQLDGGLNSVAFNWGWDETRYGPEDSHKIGQTQSQSFIQVLSGYRFKSFLQEVQGAWERDRLMNFGVDLWRDYVDYQGTPYLPAIPGEKHPYLLGFTTEGVRGNKNKAGTAADVLARLGPPRYGFELKEQAVLKRGLLGGTDEEIAKELNLTRVTVKRRWQSIYEKVAAIDEDLLSRASEPEAGEKGAKQRRRILLQSLANHPEELWPTQTSVRKSAKKRKTQK